MFNWNDGNASHRVVVMIIIIIIVNVSLSSLSLHASLIFELGTNARQRYRLNENYCSVVALSRVTIFDLFYEA